jgi:CHAD domain-containing protein
MRVATRRLRSALATFRPLFDRTVTDPLREELAWLGGILGDARDAEVIRDHLEGLLATVPGDLVLGPVSNRIVTAMGTRYRRGHDAVLAELDSERYLDLLDALDDLLTDPPLAEAAFGKRDAVLLPLVAKTYRRTRGLHDRADAETASPRQDILLHEVRKGAKRARYAAETLTPRYGKPAKKWASRMEAVQEVLGDHQDTVVIRDQVRRLAVAAHLDGENGFTYGILHTLERNRASHTGRQYAKAWRRAAKRSTHRWLKA